MKLFISADIEGCVGTTLASETHKETPEYRQFAKRMTEEVRIVCQAALEAGADEIVVKDGHGDATNIDFTAMPEGVTLIRGKSGRVYGALMSMLTTMKGIPLAYNKDMQEDKELTFDAIDTVKGCLALFTGMISSMTFRKDVMEASAKRGFTNATDAADYLVNHGVPFRDAHGIVGQLVLLCIEKGIALDDLSLEEYKEISPVFEEDIYEAISMKTCVEKRMTIGAPGPEAMKQVIAVYKKQLQ